jgi:hypothetical protein
MWNVDICIRIKGPFYKEIWEGEAPISKGMDKKTAAFIYRSPLIRRIMDAARREKVVTFVSAAAPVNSGGTGPVVLEGGRAVTVPLEEGTAVGGIYTVTVALGVMQEVEGVDDGAA